MIRWWFVSERNKRLPISSTEMQPAIKDGRYFTYQKKNKWQIFEVSLYYHTRGTIMKLERLQVTTKCKEKIKSLTRQATRIQSWKKWCFSNRIRFPFYFIQPQFWKKFYSFTTPHRRTWSSRHTTALYYTTTNQASICICIFMPGILKNWTKLLTIL